MKKTASIFFYCSLCLQLLAQNKVDSLVGLLQSAKDTGKVNVLNELTKNLWYYQLDKANDYNLKAISLADSISFEKGLAEANRCRGVIFSFKKDTSGLRFLEKALTLFRQLNDKRGVAATLNNQAGFYIDKGEYAKALDVLTESLNLFTALHDSEAIGAVTNRMGVIYEQQSDFAAALDYYLKALAIRQQISDKPGTAFSLTRVGDMYAKLNQLPQALDYYQQAYALSKTLGRNQNLSNVSIAIGDLYKKQGNYKEALNYYNISFKAEEEFGGKDGVSVSSQRLGELYLLQKNYDHALFNFQRALDITNKNDLSRSAPILYSLSKVYYEKGDYAKAKENANGSLQIALKNKKHAWAKDASLMLSQVYAAENDYQKAYQYRLQYDGAKDSVLNEDLNKRLASLQQSFEIKNRQTQIDLLSRDKQLKESELNRQKQQRIAFIIGILLFLILVIVLAGSNRQKQRTNRLLENTLSNLKAAQSQLIQSEKMASLGELTAGIAHEIQNPLNFVNNFSDVNKELLIELKDEIKKGNIDEVSSIADDVISNEEKINHHGKRADTIVKGMLQHSRSSSGVKESTDINKLADEYLRLSYHGLRSKDKSFNTTFKTDFDESIGKINIIPQDIGRVILNLINNAFYAVDEKRQNLNARPPGRTGTDRDEPVGRDYEPTVIISTAKHDSKVEIKVKDNGNGIPQKILDKIFQPFFTTKPTGQGTGLGLSLAYDIVKAHDGELKVETGKIEGAEFIIVLPIN